MTEQVQAYLDKHASEDAAFAEKMRNPRKTIKNCIKYIAQRAQKYMEQHKDEYTMEHGLGGDIDDEICFGWANHYFDETGLEIDLTDEERKAKREKEAAERKAKLDKEQAERKAKKAEEKKAAKKAAKDAAKQAKAEEKKAAAPAPAPKPEKPKKLSKSELRKGADCYSLFDF